MNLQWSIVEHIIAITKLFSRSAFDKALFSDKLNLPRGACAKKMKKNYANGFHKISVIACLRFDFFGFRYSFQFRCY